LFLFFLFPSFSFSLSFFSLLPLFFFSLSYTFLHVASPSFLHSKIIFFPLSISVMHFHSLLTFISFVNLTLMSPSLFHVTCIASLLLALYHLLCVISGLF
jgi:hypothetical protein